MSYSIILMIFSMNVIRTCGGMDLYVSYLYIHVYVHAHVYIHVYVHVYIHVHVSIIYI